MLAPGYYNMDCMAGMREFPDKYFDLAIVDPPYGRREDGRKDVGRVRITSKWKNPQPKGYKVGGWDNDSPSKHYFDELIRVSSNQIIFGANHFISKIPFDSPCWLFWDKGTSGDFADGELAWTSFNTAVRKFDWLWSGFKQREHEERIHPTQKPIHLYRWILYNYASPGDFIIDTHVGSASSLIACEQMNFKYVGFELDADYYRDSTARLIKARELLRQGDIFTIEKTNGKVYQRQDELFSNEPQNSFTRIVLDGTNGKSELKQEKVIL